MVYIHTLYYHDFVLASEVWRLTQQLSVGDRDGAGSLSQEHSVVQLHSP